MDSSTSAVPVATLNDPTPASGDRFGFSVAISENLILVGGPGDDTRATDAGLTYLFDRQSSTPGVPVTTLDDSAPALDDQFGSSVAISDSIVAIGAWLDDTGVSNSGRVYLFDPKSDAPSIPFAALDNPTPASNDQFGASVAISGQLVVVGAWLDDTGAANAGSAYVFDLESSTPGVPVATLNNPAPASNDLFGYSVAIAGRRIVVGAFRDDAVAVDSGSAYVFDLDSTTPGVPIATLNNPSPAATDWFGHSVGSSEGWIVVGAPLDDTGASGAGSAYLFDLDSATPGVPVATFENPTPAIGDNFGNAVAIQDRTIVIAALGDGTGAAIAGSVYVFDLDSNTPSVSVETLNNPAPAVRDTFGQSVAISGRLVVIGAYQDDEGAQDSGTAYLFDLNSSTPAVPVATLNNPTPAVGDQFGYAVAMFGSLAVVTAPFDDTVTTNRGIAYFFSTSSNCDPGDANADGDVNLLDAAILADNLGLQSGAGCENGDFDGDGTVGLADLIVFRNSRSPLPQLTANSVRAAAKLPDDLDRAPRDAARGSRLTMPSRHASTHAEVKRHHSSRKQDGSHQNGSTLRAIKRSLELAARDHVLASINHMRTRGKSGTIGEIAREKTRT
jgi:hypothetical protein